MTHSSCRSFEPLQRTQNDYPRGCACCAVGPLTCLLAEQTSVVFETVTFTSGDATNHKKCEHDDAAAAFTYVLRCCWLAVAVDSINLPATKRCNATFACQQAHAKIKHYQRIDSAATTYCMSIMCACPMGVMQHHRMFESIDHQPGLRRLLEACDVLYL